MEINYENYSKVIAIEAKTMIEMASRKYIPAVMKFVKNVADSVISVKNALPVADVSAQEEILSKASRLLSDAKKAMGNLSDGLAKVSDISGAKETATYFRHEIVPMMDALRAPIDELETIVDSELWPVPTYAELMFEL